MPSVFDYRDPLKCLRDLYEQHHADNPRLTPGRIAKKLGGCTSSSFYWMLQGRMHISAAHIRKLCGLFGLEGEEAEYFEHLVRARQSRRGTARRASLLRLTELWNRKVRTLSPAQRDYYATWYFAAVRALFAFYRGKVDYGEMGGLFDPPLKASEIGNAVRVLIRLGLMERGDDGSLTLTDRSISSGSSRVAGAVVRDYNQKIMAQAQQLLETLPAEERDFSTLTLSVSEKTAAKLMEELRLLRERIVAMVQFDQQADRVYQFNAQMFPVAWKRRPASRRPAQKDTGHKGGH